MSEEVSVLRLYVLRGMYLLNLVLVGSGVWIQFIHRQKPWDPIGVQLLGGPGGPVCSRNPLPAGDAPPHFHATVLQDILAARSVPSSAGGWPLKRPYAAILDRNRIGHHRDSLALCSRALHQEARRSVE